MEPLIVAGAIAGAGALSAAALWAAWRYTRAPAKAAAPVELEILGEEHPARFVKPSPSPSLARNALPARPPSPPPARAVFGPPAGVVPPRGHAERSPAMVLTQGVQLTDASPPTPQGRPFVRAPAPRPPMREPAPMKSWAQQVMESTPGEVPTEWARRQVGPVEPGRSAGACGGCGARLSVSNARPLRIACPVCGRTKLLAA